MKYLSEYRDPDKAKWLLESIHRTVTQPWMIMEVCGGQTHSLVKNGILDLLPEQVMMVHGPGCPVCVTPVSLIDHAVALSQMAGVTVCSFGDMLRVPGKAGSLLQAKAGGGSVQMVYSPLDAVQYAADHPTEEVVFFAVGFETTAPANALAVLQAEKRRLTNFSLLVSQVLVPPAMEALLSDPFNNIKAFLAAGHVCTVMGYREYDPIAQRYKVPIVVTGFEPVDLLKGILQAVTMLERGEWAVDNQYGRAVRAAGNEAAQQVITSVFEVGDREWRGIGNIPDSGYVLKPDYQAFDAVQKFNLRPQEAEVAAGCIAGDIMKGRKKPKVCPFFGRECTPQNPMGAPMVSSEGACAAYYHFTEAI